MRRGCGCALLALLAVFTAPWWVPVALVTVYAWLDLLSRLLGGA